MIPQNQKEILPLSFPVDVVGVKQQATVLEDVSDVEAFRYKVRFEDGFEDIFTLVEGPELYIETTVTGHEHHANAVLNDLYILTTIEPGIFFYMLPMKLDEEPINVWMIESEPDQGEQEIIGIHYNGKLQFEIYFTDEAEDWCYRGIRGPLTPAEQSLAKELATTLQSMRSALNL